VNLPMTMLHLKRDGDIERACDFVLGNGYTFNLTNRGEAEAILVLRWEDGRLHVTTQANAK
jgi:hypothetical protein